MAEVVEHSTSHLTHDDLHAMAVYLRDLPADGGSGPGKPSDDHDVLTRGRLVYLDQCAGCHMENGEGQANVFPAIKGNTGVHASDPTSLARLVLEGARSARTRERREGFAMPGFADKLTDGEIADVLTYVRASFGNQAGPVSSDRIADVRKAMHDGDGG
jgi:mono/diheme cytochrome c family protein